MKTKKYKVRAAVGTDDVWKRVTAVLETRAGPNMVKANCLPPA